MENSHSTIIQSLFSPKHKKQDTSMKEALIIWLMIGTNKSEYIKILALVFVIWKCKGYKD